MNDAHNNSKVLCDIAQLAFEIVNSKLSLDETLARDLRSAETGSRQVFREESITEDLVAALRQRFPEHVQITLFTPPEEARSGADWYWRFEKNGRGIHARVQAKRVRRSEFGESDDHGHIEINERQLSTLVDATNRDAARMPGLRAWLATYARVQATPPCGHSELQSCRLHGHPHACGRQVPSLWIANAQDIQRELHRFTSEPSVIDIVQCSVRLDCVLPCIDDASPDGPASKGFTLRAGLPTFQECISTITTRPDLLSVFRGALRITL